MQKNSNFREILSLDVQNGSGYDQNTRIRNPALRFLIIICVILVGIGRILPEDTELGKSRIFQHKNIKKGSGLLEGSPPLSAILK